MRFVAVRVRPAEADREAQAARQAAAKREGDTIREMWTAAT